MVQKKFEDKVGKMKITRGKEHTYLGMNLDFSIKGEVKIGMTEYVDDMIDKFSEKITGTVNTPAAENLFQVNETSRKLNNNKAQEFHTIVAKGLFLCKRARPDIQTTIAFLTTRVREPDEDDWKKLIRLLKYLNGTRKLAFILKLE